MIVGFCVLTTWLYILCIEDCSPHVTKWWSFQSSFGHSNYSCILIFTYRSGWPIHSPIEYSVKLQPLRLFLYSNIQLYVRLTNSLTNPIFSQTAATLIIPVYQYSIIDQADPFTHQSNIWLQVRLTHAFTNWIFIQALATPIIPIFQYLIMNQADPYIHQLNIHSSFSHSNYSCIPIFNYESGWPIHSPIEYSFKLRPLWLFLYSNIQL